MNWSFYEALDRLPLGVAVTIEFTGPLAVAFAGSRRLLDGLWVALAGAGVVLLALRGGDSGVSTLGVVLALVAASCWAVYILLAKRVGSRVRALDALALALVFGTVLVLPAGIVEGGSRLGHPGVIAAGAGVAVLSSLDARTRWSSSRCAGLATHVFGLLMSLEPAVAAIAGHRRPGPVDHARPRRRAGAGDRRERRHHAHVADSPTRRRRARTGALSRSALRPLTGLRRTTPGSRCR